MKSSIKIQKRFESATARTIVYEYIYVRRWQSRRETTGIKEEKKTDI